MVDQSPSAADRLLTTRFCTLVGVRHPVVLGGMGPPHTSPELVAAVSNAGGLGILGCSGLSPVQIAEGAARVRELTSEPFGLNLLLFAVDDDAVAAVLAARPNVASFAWPRQDQPLDEIFTRAHHAGCLVMHMVADTPEARRAAAAGADIVVAQGTEGGGHVGVMATMPLVPQVVDAIAPVPVLAAGGIADGRGLAAALMLGAEGVLLGTRFLATREAPGSDGVKQIIVNSDGRDTDLTEIPDIISGTVWPGAFARTWRNALLREWTGREWELRQRLPEVVAAIAEANAAGDLDRVPVMFGQDVGLIGAVEPVKDVVEGIVRQASDLLARGSDRFSTPSTAGVGPAQ